MNENIKAQYILELVDEATALEVYSDMLTLKSSIETFKYLERKGYLELLDVHSNYKRNYNLNREDRMIIIKICDLTKDFLEHKKAEELAHNGELVIGEYESDGERTYANLWFLGELLIAVEPFETEDGSEVKYKNRFFVDPDGEGVKYKIYLEEKMPWEDETYSQKVYKAHVQELVSDSRNLGTY